LLGRFDIENARKRRDKGNNAITASFKKKDVTAVINPARSRPSCIFKNFE
jgi:hypothetical protein